MRQKSQNITISWKFPTSPRILDKILRKEKLLREFELSMYRILVLQGYVKNFKHISDYGICKMPWNITKFKWIANAQNWLYIKRDFSYRTYRFIQGFRNFNNTFWFTVPLKCSEPISFSSSRITLTYVVPLFFKNYLYYFITFKHNIIYQVITSMI